MMGMDPMFEEMQPEGNGKHPDKKAAHADKMTEYIFI